MKVVTKQEGLLVDAQVLVGKFDSQQAAMDAAEAQQKALDSASGTDAFGRRLNEAEEIAAFVLAARGLPTDFPNGQPSLVEIGTHTIRDWRSAITEEQLTRLAADQSLEVREAVSLKLRCFDLRHALAGDTEEQRELCLSLVTLGREMERLTQHKLHGARLDAKRRSDAAIAARAHSEQTKQKIQDVFAEKRRLCRTDADAYRMVVDHFADLPLTEHAVRHIVKPSNRKATR
jgi:hypothetical protein